MPGKSKVQQKKIVLNGEKKTTNTSTFRLTSRFVSSKYSNMMIFAKVLNNCFVKHSTFNSSLKSCHRHLSLDPMMIEYAGRRRTQYFTKRKMNAKKSLPNKCMHSLLTSHILFLFDATIWHALREAQNVQQEKNTHNIVCLEVEELQYYFQPEATTALLALLNLIPAKKREERKTKSHCYALQNAYIFWIGMSATNVLNTETFHAFKY